MKVTFKTLDVSTCLVHNTRPYFAWLPVTLT